MKIKVFCVILGILLFFPLVAAHQVEIYSDENIIENNIINNQNDVEQPKPHWGLSFVFYIGKAIVYDCYYKEDLLFLTVRPISNKIKWFCIGRPFGQDSASGSFVVGIDYFKGYVGPKPIEKDGIINFIFGLARDIVVMIP
ncbi:MAG: hypothetical protein ACFFDN_03930 [Candidatus Hodarchaeota archaeon]